jgi:DNA-binding LytR/AlgR family response regulator
MSVAGPKRKTALIFSILCGFAASQLIVETSKALLDYSYPFHDVRLILITFLSTGFGLFIAIHIFRTFTNRFALTAVVAVVISTVISVILANGYDGKAEAGMLAPIAISMIYVAWSAYQGQPRAFLHFLFLLGFIIAILAFPTLFLDSLFFFLVAALLLFLFIEQGLKLAKETKELRLEAARVSQLEFALEQADERAEASEINVKSAGRIERLTTDQIGHCRGVDGYTEIILMNGRKLLHSATLTEMEKAVPATFLKVHRSYLVNTSFVQSLDRDPAGTGRLILTDGSEIPISRRIMPKVRKALG